MDRRSWLWRRKSSEKSTGETESSGGSVSSHSERFSDDQVYSNQNSQSLEVASTISQRTSEHNHVVKSLSDKLLEALASINAKEQLVNQHAKVAEEAVSGWENAEQKVVALRQQVEVLTARNSTLEDRVVHLDEALKECMRQLRQTREEKEQIANEALEKKVSGSESSLTSIETSLHQKLEMIEKENSDLKHKISSMAEELEIRIIERDLSNQAAEQASKQRLDSVKKVARLEAGCRRLNSALKKANNNNNNPIKAHKKPSVTEKGDFKETGRLVRNRVDSVIEIDLMDDFLEMERLVALPGTCEVEDRGNELKDSRNRLEEAESKLADRENELKASRNQVKEAESKLADCENELKTTRNRFKEAESKSTELENELKTSRNSLEEAESKLSKCKNELKVTRNRLEEAESKLYDRENELEESESKMAECENELNESTNRLEEAESKLAERENELKLSRYQLEKAESKLAELEIELNASTYLLEEAEFKLHNTTNRLEMCEAGLEDAQVKKEEAESRCKALEAEIEMLLSKADYLENNIQKEQNLSRQTEAKYQDLKDEVSKLQHEVQDTKSRNRAEEFRFLKIKQDKELAIAGSQFVECQKTIASLNRQLQALATLDDFLIDTNSL
ncbi:filament-like plant protein 3 [Bidens hawaiensis]|uniref:filament-like plant protein 3 n=1 Tax=Bidens hawaiensis TaxID=980011 RepID=UPI00404B8175